MYTKYNESHMEFFLIISCYKVKKKIVADKRNVQIFCLNYCTLSYMHRKEASLQTAFVIVYLRFLFEFEYFQMSRHYMPMALWKDVNASGLSD